MKVVGIPGRGGMSKFVGKTRISKGVNAKKWKTPGGKPIFSEEYRKLKKYLTHIYILKQLTIRENKFNLKTTR